MKKHQHQLQFKTARRHIKHRSRGVTIVELAVLLPLLITFVLAATDFGRVVHAYLSVSNAARCGADFGSTHQLTSHNQATWEAKVREAAVNDLRGLGNFNESDLTVEITSNLDTDNLLEITIETAYPFRTLVAWPLIPSSITMRHSVTTRRIR